MKKRSPQQNKITMYQEILDVYYYEQRKDRRVEKMKFKDDMFTDYEYRELLIYI
jgi:hypothetical protein